MRITEEILNEGKQLLDFINDSPTQFNAIYNFSKILKENGYVDLDISKKWDLQLGGTYFTTKNSSALLAFRIDEDKTKGKSKNDICYKIIGSHSDSPTFRIKPNSEIIEEKTYLKLNVEPYGGMILSTWFDRPLSIAGRVIVKSENIFKPKEEIIKIDKPICIIPNLAIHMNRDVNSGYKYNKQKDMLPILADLSENLEKENYLLKIIAKKLDIDISEIIDFDLFLYEYQKGEIIGVDDEFISSGRLDNLSMAHSSIKALLNSSNKEINIDSKNTAISVKICAIFDNEEVGSSTKQGANSNLLTHTMERIALNLGKTRDDYLRSFEESFILSADLAHAIHPNYKETHDPTNRPLMGRGPVIKIHAGQAYTSDAYSISVYKNICDKCDVKYQEFVNRSDKRGGTTIGPLTSTHTEIPSVDIGSPILAMHSIRELGSIKDHYEILKTFKLFYEL